jgi:hypothetical protein
MFASGAHASPTISRSSSLSINTTPSRRPSFVADGCQTSSSSLVSPRRPTGFTLDKHRSARDLWMDKGSFWEKLEVTDQTSSLGNSAERRIHQLKVSCYTQSYRFQSPSTCRVPERLQSPVITRGARSQVAKHIIHSTPSILVVPLLCCLVVLLTNVISVLVLAGETNSHLLFVREQNVKLVDAVNTVRDREEMMRDEQRKLMESITLELQARLLARAESVRAPTNASTSGCRSGVWVADGRVRRRVQLTTIARMVEVDVQMHRTS